MSEAVISIIVPVYKVERYLPVCIESILQQTYPYLQIFLVDDRSPDRCPEICDAYALKDSRIQVIHQGNSGLCTARNTALKKAEGKYILFVDSDDFLFADGCERLVRCAEKKFADLVAGHYCFVDEMGRPERKRLAVPSRIIEEEVVDGQAFLRQKLKAKVYECMVWKNLYRREFLLEHSLYFLPGILREDEEWMPRVLCYAARVAEISEPFYQYRIRRQSIMANDALAVQRQLDFIEKVAPSLSEKLRFVDSGLYKMLMNNLLHVFFTDLAVHWWYFALHPKRLRLSFWKPFVINRNSLFWFRLLRINAALFALVWNIRSWMKV